MVAVSLIIGNQLPVNSPTSSRSKITKMVHKNKQTCNNNFQSQRNSVSAPFVTNKSFTVFHQNIRSLRNKNNELIESMLPKLPHVICLTEHHSVEQEIETLSIDHYILGAKFCRQSIKHGGTGIFVHESLAFTIIDLQESCMQQDIEACAVKINLLTTVIYTICIYRSQTGNFAQLIKGIDTILNQFSKPNIEIIVCGDIHVDYIDETCYQKKQLGALLATYSVISTVRFPTRSLNGSSSAIDNIFIDIYHKGKYTIYPLINGLSDHDGQIIQLENMSIQTQLNETRIIRNFNKHYVHDIKTKLSYEIWDTIFGENDVDKIFNNFHNTFLRSFYSSILKKKIQVQYNLYLDDKRYKDIHKPQKGTISE
jgi:hypothetical protein